MYLNINSPCSQSWHQMQEANNGRFCVQCEKTVVDFSRMSDSDIIDYMKNHPQVCGRLHVNQLNRALIHPENKRKGLWLKIAAAFTGIFMGQSAFSQTPVVENNTTFIPVPVITIPDQAQQQEKAELVTIKGRVMNANTGHHVSWATVQFGELTEIKTDRLGYFQMQIDKSQIGNISYISAHKNNISGDMYLASEDISDEVIIRIGGYIMGWVVNPLCYLYETTAVVDSTQLNRDSDNDGVIDRLDKEPNTSALTPVDMHGVALDSDKDGCVDAEDPEPYSSPVLPIENCENVHVMGVIVSGFVDQRIPPLGCIYSPMVFFDENSFVLRPDAIPELEYIAEFMKRYPRLKVEFFGFSDLAETEDGLLAEKRAMAVIAYLVKKGVPENALILSHKIDPPPLIKAPKTEEERMQNRRVEYNYIR